MRSILAAVTAIVPRNRFSDRRRVLFNCLRSDALLQLDGSIEVSLDLLLV